MHKWQPARSHSYLFCLRERGAALSEALGRRPSFAVAGCVVFVLGDAEASPSPDVIGAGARRYLDRFWLMPEDDVADQERLLAGFFDTIAESYASQIQDERNRDNAARLLDVLLGSDPSIPAGAIVDLGCGPGTGLELIARTGRRAIGVELSERMRHIASARGYDVYGAHQLECLASETIAGAIASYVLHLDPTPSNLPQLLSLLPPDGALVANFHKRQGLQEFLDYAAGLGSDAVVLPVSHPDHHGPYVRVQRTAR